MQSPVGPGISCNQRLPIYHHVKKLMFTVRVDEPDPRFGIMLLEQFVGANGRSVRRLWMSFSPSMPNVVLRSPTTEIRQSHETLRA